MMTMIDCMYVHNESYTNENDARKRMYNENYANHDNDDDDDDDEKLIEIGCL